MAAARGPLARLFRSVFKVAPLATEFEFGEFVDLGPFRPPLDFEFEPELLAPAPRELPDDLRQREVTQWRRAAAVCGTIGALLFAIAPLPLVQHWAAFVPVLGHLSWISIALVAAAVLLHFGSSWAKVRNQDYFILGEPLVVRVCRVWMQPGLFRHGQPFFYHFCATIEYPDMVLGVMLRHSVASIEIPAAKKDRFETTYHAGDYATALQLSAGDSNLYGFLGLTPGFGVVDRKQAKPRSILHTVLMVVGSFALLAVPTWAVSSIERFRPLDEMTNRQLNATLTTGSVLGLFASLSIFALWVRGNTRRVRERIARAAEAGEAIELTIEDLHPERRATLRNVVRGIFFVAVGMLLGNVAAVGAFYSMNALLDESAPRQERVTITDMVQKDHRWMGIPLVRGFTIEYRFPDNPRKRECLSTPEEMAQFKHKVGFARVRSGFFGLRWVEAITP